MRKFNIKGFCNCKKIIAFTILILSLPKLVYAEVDNYYLKNRVALEVKKYKNDISYMNSEEINQILNKTIFKNNFNRNNYLILKNENLTSRGMIDRNSEGIRRLKEIELRKEKEIFIRGERSEIKEILWNTSQKYELSPYFVYSVAMVETGETLNPNTLGPRTYCGRAKGIMQLMPEISKDLKIKDIWDPEENINGGSKYLKILCNKYGVKNIEDDNNNILDVEILAVIAYNWGEGNLDKHLEKYEMVIISKLPYETREYIKKLKKYKNEKIEMFYQKR